jgi:hypothetical protein
MIEISRGFQNNQGKRLVVKLSYKESCPIGGSVAVKSHELHHFNVDIEAYLSFVWEILRLGKNLYSNVFLYILFLSYCVFMIPLYSRPSVSRDLCKFPGSV